MRSVCNAPKEGIEEAGCLLRYAGHLVGCLTIKLEVNFYFRTAIVPMVERGEFGSIQFPGRQRMASDHDIYTRSLSCKTWLL